ncbi:MAG TPA: hypothetical protein VI381_02665 [Allosphingosinicella sp.]
MKTFRTLPIIALTALAACVPQREKAPAPPPPAPAPPPPAPAPPPPSVTNWADIPLTPGNWYYNDEGQVSSALFGPPASEAAFIVRCDKAQGRITLLREGATSGQTMTIRTSFTARNLPVSVQAEPLSYIWVALDAGDPLLDSIAFSRGRFTVEVPGTPMLVIPAWPEPARVVEDCRK